MLLGRLFGVDLKILEKYNTASYQYTDIKNINTAIEINSTIWKS